MSCTLEINIMSTVEEGLIAESIIQSVQEKHTKVSEDPLEYGLVVYTDGSGQLGRPNIGGYGFHGFVYCNTASKQGAGVKGNIVTNYGYLANGKAGQKIKLEYEARNPEAEKTEAIAEQRIPVVYIDGNGSLLDATNNVAEATGFLKALQTIVRVHQQVKLSQVHFRIDSKYVIESVRFRSRLRQNGFRKQDGQLIANRDLWENIFDELDNALSIVDCPWTVEWVKGHSDYFGNIQADKLAKMGLVGGLNDYFFDDLTISPAQGHWSSKASEDAHYFLVDHKWYVAATRPLDQTSDGLNVIYTGTHEDDERVGQLVSDNIQSVAFLKDVPASMLTIKQMVSDMDELELGLEVAGIYSGHLNHILNPNIGGTVSTAGGKFVKINRWAKQLTSYDGRELMTRLAGRLELDAITRFGDLASLLDQVRSDKLDPFTAVTDITDLIYEVDTSKKKETTKLKIGNDPSLKCDVKVRVHDSNFMYSDVISQVTLTYGITTPRRRVFSGIKDDKPKVLVVTVFEPYVAYRYYTVILLENGECGIWTNVAANLRLL